MILLELAVLAVLVVQRKKMMEAVLAGLVVRPAMKAVLVVSTFVLAVPVVMWPLPIALVWQIRRMVVLMKTILANQTLCSANWRAAANLAAAVVLAQLKASG